MKTINVNGFDIGGKKTYIIADVGANHMQDLQLAKESIDAAKQAGADAVKFQSIQVDELYLNPDKATRDFVKQLEFPEAWHRILYDYAQQQGITFFSSPTYLKAVDLLEEINVPIYKLASAQVGTFPQIVEKVAALHKPTIFSTGISALAEVEQAAAIFNKYQNEQFIILHCNSMYPTPAHKVNLPLMQRLAAMYPNNPVGFSDHTIGTHTACAAVSMGAKVIEKHFTLNRNFPSPDSNAFACDPQELALLVNQIRDIEQSIQSVSDRLHIEQPEQEFKDAITYRIVAARAIDEGQILAYEDIKYLRAPNGINCKLVHEVIGRKASQQIPINELITTQLLND
jgi:sialic acid synthase SpsE